MSSEPMSSGCHFWINVEGTNDYECAYCGGYRFDGNPWGIPADAGGGGRGVSDILWLGDPGARDTPDERRATFIGPPKAFCPCDTGNPQDCKPEEWRPAHSPRPPCERCGMPLHSHQGNYCRRPRRD